MNYHVEKRSSMDAIQKCDHLVHDALIDFAKCRSRHGYVPAPMIADPEGFERRPIQSVEEVFARSTE